MKALSIFRCLAAVAAIHMAPFYVGMVLAAEPQEDEVNPFEIAPGPGPSAPLPKWGVVRLGVGSKRVFSGVRQIAFSPDGRHVAAGDGQCARIWEIEGPKEDCSILLRQSSLTLLTFARDGQALITSGSKVGEEIRLWNTETGENLATFGPGGPFVGTSSDSATLFVGGDSQIVRYSVATGKEQHRSSLQPGPLALAPAGQYIAFVSPLANDRGLPRVEIRDMSGAGHSKLDGLEGPPTCALFSPDGARFAAADRESSHVHLWVLGSPSRTPALRGHAAPVNAMAFSTDGRHLATASDDTTVVLWEVATGQPIVTLRGHCEPVVSVAFSADGRRLATGAAGPTDATVVIWDVAGALYTPSYKTHPGMKPEELDDLWDALAVDEPKPAYGAIGAFTSIPQEAISYLEDQLRETFLTVSREEIDALVRQLGDDDYFVRERAQQQLPKLRMQADRALRQALADSPVNELHYRVRKVLQIPLPKSQLGETQRRQIRRTILALELIATPQAVELLGKIANAYPDIDIMNEGFASWNRLKSKTR